ncbi:hypothetical protein DXA95_11425 [Odoribacter sp. OF09-27XD]|nr:hypothetical protein DXA95_11425 [Odoribacter sp. OF09-27XD]
MHKVNRVFSAECPRTFFIIEKSFPFGNLYIFDEMIQGIVVRFPKNLFSVIKFSDLIPENIYICIEQALSGNTIVQYCHKRLYVIGIVNNKACLESRIGFFKILPD